MRKMLGFLAAAALVTGLALPATAEPGGRCAGPVDALCTWRNPDTNQDQDCHYYIDVDDVVEDFCGVVNPQY